MGKITTFFFDSYAFYEIANKNPNYEKYTRNVAIITTKLNLMELYYGLLVNYNQETAEKFYNKLARYTIELDDETIKKAMIFRAENRRNKPSYTDCIGYILAIQRNIKFLTGDEGFKNLPNVEFIK